MNLKTTLTCAALCFFTMAVAPGATAAPAATRNDPDAFNAYEPGTYLESKVFHVPAGASFAWQAWENPNHQIGAILVNDSAEQAYVKIEQVELARPSEGEDSLVLNQYTLTVNGDVPPDTILQIRTTGGAADVTATTGAAGAGGSTDDHRWAFGFVLHIVAADKYMMLLKQLHVT